MKLTYRTDNRHARREREANQKQALAAKQALIKNYQRKTAIETPHKSDDESNNGSTASNSSTINDELKRENRRLLRQIKQIKRQHELQLTELRHQQLQTQQQLHAVRKRLNQRENQLAELQTQQVTLQNRHQKALTEIQSYVDSTKTMTAWLVQGLSLYTAADEKMDLARLQQWRNQKEQPLTKKEKLHLQEYPNLKLQVMNLNARLQCSSTTITKLTSENQHLRQHRRTTTSGSTRPLVEQVMKKITLKRIDQIPWLPSAYRLYKKVLLEEVLVNDGNRIFGYFIKIKGGFYFQVLNGASYRSYRQLGPARRALTPNAVYAGKVDGDMVLLTDIFMNITPQQLHNQHELQLHRKHGSTDYRRLLPGDAVTKLTGKRIVVVTWQRTQTLNKMLHAFGIIPLIVNDHEKSAGWIAIEVLSKQTDFALLLSEGLSHHMLETIGKDKIKERRNIELVYNESPEELLRRCYRYFSQE